MINTKYSKIDERFDLMNNIWKMKFKNNLINNRESKKVNINKFIALLLKSFMKKMNRKVFKSNKPIDQIEIRFIDLKQNFVNYKELSEYLNSNEMIKNPKNKEIPWENLSFMQILKKRNIVCEKRTYALIVSVKSDIVFILKLK